MANGWLSPKGKFFQCAIGKHHVKAQELATKNTRETWVVIYKTGAFSELPLTEAQIAWLINSLKVNKDECYHDMVEILLEKQNDYTK